MRTGASRRLKAGPKSKAAKLVLPVAAGVIVVAAVAGWWFFLRATPEKAVAQYAAAAKTGNEAAAKAFLTADTVKAVDDLEQAMQTQAPTMAGNFKVATGLVGRVGQGAELQIGKAKVQGGTATVPVTVKQGKAQGGSPATTSPKGGRPRRGRAGRGPHGRRPSPRDHGQARGRHVEDRRHPADREDQADAGLLRREWWPGRTAGRSGHGPRVRPRHGHGRWHGRGNAPAWRRTDGPAASGGRARSGASRWSARTDASACANASACTDAVASSPCGLARQRVVL